MENLECIIAGNRLLNAWNRTVIAMAFTAAVLAMVILAGCFGWKLFGFLACQGAGIETAQENGDFRNSSVSGFFETSHLDITVPVRGEINQVILRTGRKESVLWESGKYSFMDNDIMIADKGSGAPFPFTIIVKGAGGTVLAVRKFQFDAYKEKVLLTITANGQIIEGKVPYDCT